MRRLFRVMAVLAVAAWPAVPVAAADGQPAAPDFSSASDADLAAVAAQEPEPSSLACTLQVPAARELTGRHPEDSDLQAELLYNEIHCAIGENRYADAKPLIGAYEELAGRSRFTKYMDLLVALSLNDGPATLALLREFSRDETFEGLPAGAVNPAMKVVIAAGMSDELGRFALDYSASANFAKLDPEFQEVFGGYALDAAIGLGDREKASFLLGFMRKPTLYYGPLGDKRFAQFWPEFEERVGDHFAKITASYLDWAKTRYRQDKDDRARFQAQAWALYYDNRFEEAVAFVRKEGRDRDALFQMESDDAWGLQVEALSLDRLGRKDEASAVYDKLASAPPGQISLVSFVINRALRMLDGGNWGAGLAAIDEAGKVADVRGSLYARMNVAYGRTCALYQLGRPGEAEGDLAFLRANADESVPLAAMGLLCAKQEQQAVDLLMGKLADERTRSGVILQLQPAEFANSNSVLPRIYDLRGRYPQLQAEFERYGRVIPARFAPPK